jgi:hypothetical protein
MSNFTYNDLVNIEMALYEFEKNHPIYGDDRIKKIREKIFNKIEKQHNKVKTK